MLIASCQLELFIAESGSLKEKRYVIQSLKSRIRQKFNVSIIEVDENDKWQYSVLGIAIAGKSRNYLDSTFSKILHLIEKDGRAEVVQQLVEVV